MNDRQILDWIESQISSKLSDLQQEIVKESCQGKTYQDIANSYGYNVQYVKDVGYRLWNLLSQVCEEKITKKNFRVKIEKITNPSTNTVNKYRDWSDAPNTSLFFGRNRELKLFKQWIVGDCCRLVGIVGMGGMGKTKLATKLGQEIQDEFEYVIWRSLVKPLPIENLITDLIKLITNEEINDISHNLEGQISQLLSLLKQHRCLLIIDNIETILDSYQYAGIYDRQYQEYDRLFSKISLVNHQSCLILTSREKPSILDRMSGKNHPVRLLELSGLNYLEGKDIFQAIGNFSGSDREWQTLIEFYNGNPIVLELAAHHIQAVFNKKIDRFLQEGNYIFDDLQKLLDSQFDRLSHLEKKVVEVLATNPKSISLAELKTNLRASYTKQNVTNILQSLSRRTIIQITSFGYNLQPMLREYINYQKGFKTRKTIKIVPPEIVSFGCR